MSSFFVQSVPGSLPVNLRMVSVPIIDQDQCAQAWPTGWITDEYVLMIHSKIVQDAS